MDADSPLNCNQDERTMLLGIAVLGKNNEPLYLRNCRTQSAETENGDDPLDLCSMTSEIHSSLPLEDQIVMHAALDCFEEKTERNANGQMPTIKKQGSSSAPHWVGLLLTLGRNAVYGYVTATNIKFFTLVEANTDAKAIHTFLKSVHASYIEYIMNPFFTTKGGIQSSTFDAKIKLATEVLHGKSESIV